ncbi:MAG: Cas10/Cmr2 second palm domain-containing protein, partial [bacterium]
MSACHAVLLDTVSIQPYIFQSNKLKENLGASYLVQEIYRSYLACALCPITGRTFEEELQHLDDWKHAEAPDGTKPVGIGYIGGGNALLFFQNEGQARKFIEEWTKILLVHAPGLTTAVAHRNFSLDQFQPSFEELFIQLKHNKARYSPITSLPRHGITAECARSGVSAEIYNELVEAYVSAGVNARIEAATESKEKLEEKYQGLLGGNYCFSNELEDLGGISGEDS